MHVAPGSAAERAGLRAGDRIRRIGRETGTAQMDERAYTFRLEPPGTVVALEIERGGQRSTIALNLGPQRRRTRGRRPVVRVAARPRER